MKKIILCFLSCLMAVGAMAVETTDYIKLSTATVNPGGDEVKVTVSLVGSENYYSGYNMDIHLPQGMEVVAKNNKYATRSGIYPYTMEYNEALEMDVPTYTHSVSSSYGVVGDRILRVACISTSNEALTATSGNLFTFYVKASSFVKPGAAQITIDGVALKVAGGSEYDPVSRVDENITVSTSATASMTVSSTNQWSTCILPFDVALPDGVKAYTCTEKDDENSVLKLTSASSISGYTPYILYSEDGYSGSLTGTVDASKYPATGYVTCGFLNGAITAQQITSGYVLQNLSEGVKFYNCNGSTFSIPAGKCWVVMPSSPSKSWSFSIEDESTGINDIENSNKESKSAVFTLGGQRVNSVSQNGVYIMNGKKILVK